jgi:hypothetical protein
MRAEARRLRATALAGILACTGCGAGGQEVADLHARMSVLEREVESMGEVASRLDRGEPALPEEDVIVALNESLVKEMLEAQLPFETEVNDYRLWLEQAEVRFRGSPGVTLLGGIALKDRPRVSGQVRVIGALDEIEVDPGTGILRAAVAIDHLDLIEVLGVEGVLGGNVLNTLAQTIRHQLDGRLPGLTIPVKVEQRIDLPSVTDGPVRIQGATLPLAVTVSQVLAGQEQLWVAVRFEPGEFVKVDTPPPPLDATGAPSGEDQAAVREASS